MTKNKERRTELEKPFVEAKLTRPEGAKFRTNTRAMKKHGKLNDYPNDRYAGMELLKYESAAWIDTEKMARDYCEWLMDLPFIDRPGDTISPLAMNKLGIDKLGWAGWNLIYKVSDTMIGTKVYEPIPNVGEAKKGCLSSVVWASFFHGFIDKELITRKDRTGLWSWTMLPVSKKTKDGKEYKAPKEVRTTDKNGKPVTKKVGRRDALYPLTESLFEGNTRTRIIELFVAGWREVRTELGLPTENTQSVRIYSPHAGIWTGRPTYGYIGWREMEQRIINLGFTEEDKCRIAMKYIMLDRNALIRDAMKKHLAERLEIYHRENLK